MAEKTDEHRGKGPCAPKQIAQLYAGAAADLSVMTGLPRRVADAARAGKRELASQSVLEIGTAKAQSRRHSSRGAQ
jgi:hypothetical protein